MESVTIKLQKKTAQEIDKLAKRFHYSTKTEFIRESIRDKIKQLETEGFMKKLSKYKGAARVRHSDEEFRRLRNKAGEQYLKELEKKFR